MKIFPQLFSRKPRSPRSNDQPPRLLRFRGHFIIEFSSFRVSRLFDLGDLGVLEKSWGNIFNDYIFEISRFHWSKCTVECAIYSILILKSAQARCEFIINQEKILSTFLNWYIICMTFSTVDEFTKIRT